jgi:hypothetical protein
MTKSNITGLSQQSTFVSSGQGTRRLIQIKTSDPQAVVEAPGYINRWDLGPRINDGDVLEIIGPDFTQSYDVSMSSTSAAIDLTPIGGFGPGTVMGDGNITNVALVGTNLVFTGVAGGFNGAVSLAGVLPVTYMRSITGIDLKPTGLPNQYTVSLTWLDQNGVTQTTNDTSPVTISFNETVTTMSDNGNGTYTYTSENGTATLIAPTGVVTTLVDNLDGTFTYTNEAGTTTTIAASNITTTLVDNLNASFTYTNELGVATIYAERVTTLVNNNNGSFTYTNEAGVPVTYNERVSTLVRNPNTSYTYTDETGVQTIFHGVNMVNTAAALPNPTTVAAGSIWVVNADSNLAFNGLYKTDGSIGSNGNGYTKI